MRAGRAMPISDPDRDQVRAGARWARVPQPRLAGVGASLRWKANGKTLALGLLLAGLVVLFYWPALKAGFVWDDDKYVTDNPLLTAPDGWRRIWFSTHAQSQYFPLVYSTFRVERRLWGLNPLGYHLVNVLLHAANSVLVWVVLRRLAVPAAWLAAGVFALHPVQVESVAWVTELKNVESLLFYLLALLAWMRFLDLSEAGERRSPPTALSFHGRPGAYYLLAMGAFLLALFAKTTACTLPAAMVLVLWLRPCKTGPGPASQTDRRGPSAPWARALQIAPFVLLGAAMGLVSVWWEGNLGTYNEETNVSCGLGQRALKRAGRSRSTPPSCSGRRTWPSVTRAGR